MDIYKNLMDAAMMLLRLPDTDTEILCGLGNFLMSESIFVSEQKLSTLRLRRMWKTI